MHKAASMIVGQSCRTISPASSRFFPVIPNWVKAEFQTESFNVLNHAAFAQTKAYANEPNFGEITSAVYGPDESETRREIEFAMRFTFWCLVALKALPGGDQPLSTSPTWFIMHV